MLPFAGENMREGYHTILGREFPEGREGFAAIFRTILQEKKTCVQNY